MSHLSIRTSSEDEHNISELQAIWGKLDRSDIGRRAIAFAVNSLKKEKTLSRAEILENSEFIGSYNGAERLRPNWKKKLKTSLKKKHGLQ